MSESPAASINLRLVRFEAQHAAAVLSWIHNSKEALWWAGLDAVPADPGLFAGWHSDPDVRPAVLLLNEVPVGYGELWENFDAYAIELARLIIAPGARRTGLGHVLIEKLRELPEAAAARRIYLRVRRENEPALRCYAHACYSRVSAEEECVFNTGQPVEYIWMVRSNGVGIDVAGA